MSKRRLSNRQQSRIGKRQKQAPQKDWQTGVVIAHHGKSVDIAPLNDILEVDLDALCRCHFRANLPTLVCGDRVYFHPARNTKNGVVETLLPRTSVIERPRPFADPKPVAANIDSIVLVFAVEPEPVGALLDRYLIAAENAGLEIHLLVNKYDVYQSLGNDAVCREIDELCELYDQLGYCVFLGSSMDNSLRQFGKEESAARLESLFTGKCSILAGQSGVGKSSIINAVVGRGSAETGDVSDATVKGKHTTTTSQMYFLPGNTARLDRGAIIDSPGIREFGLWHLSRQQVIDGMPEFRRLATKCRFRDCDHEYSEGCAILDAIASGVIHERRLASYRQILESLQTSG